MLVPVIDQIDRFVKGPRRVSWLHSDHMSIYVRKGTHVDENNEIRKFIDLANIQVDIGYRGEGRFTNLLCHLEEQKYYEGIFVEAILNRRLWEFLVDRGYQPLNMDCFLITV